MAVVHEQVHQLAGQHQQPRQHSEKRRCVLGQEEKAADDEKTGADDADRRTPERLFLRLFLHWHDSESPSRAAEEEVEDRAENDGDVPAPSEALDQSEKEGVPAWKREAGQENRQGLVLHRHTWEQEVTDDAKRVRDHEEHAERLTKRDDETVRGLVPYWVPSRCMPASAI